MKKGLFKTASTSSGSVRSRTGGQSIRGKISAPIPIPNPVNDDEFPIRNPGTNIAPKNPGDDEFPIRQRGTGIASSNPLDDEKPQPTSEELEQELGRELERSLEEREQDGESRTQAQVPASSSPHAASPSPIAAILGTRNDDSRSSPSPLVPASDTLMNGPGGEAAPAPTPSSAAPPTPARATPSAAGSSRNSPNHKRAKPSSTLRYSVASNASGVTGPSAAESQPQRKKSTLRSALSRLFGRKKKNAGSSQSSGGETDRTFSIQPSQHRSDPTALNRTKEVEREREPKRSTSLPITEYDRALRSHSIGPQDITAIESARNSLQADVTVGRRRATTTTTAATHLFGPSRRAELSEWGGLSGLSPRPVSSHGHARASSHLMGSSTDDDDPNMIGRAITSDMGGPGRGEYTYRRRSRSLSGIDALEGAPDGRSGVRRRSDEIRYWRESYGVSFLSPLSSTHPDNDGDGDGDGDGDPDGDDTGVLSLDLGKAACSAHSGVEALPPKTPPQPFDFGTLANMNEMAGMKITQAAGIESRIGNLASRVQKVERVVDQLCHAVPGFRGPLTASSAPAADAVLGLGFTSDQIPRSVPRSVPSVVTSLIPAAYHTAAMSGAVVDRMDMSGSRYSSSRQSLADTDGHSFGEGQTYIGGSSLPPPSSATTQPQAFSHHQPLQPSIPQGSAATIPFFSPVSTSTVRGATSLPALADAASASGICSSHESEAVSRTMDTAATANLVAQLEAERAARMALELQVKKLSERVNSLSTTMFAIVHPHKSRSQERLTAPSTGTGGDQQHTSGNISAPSKEQSQQNSATTATMDPPGPVSIMMPTLPRSEKTRITKPRSVFEHDDDDQSDSGLRPGGGLGDETPSESVFQTPRQTPREEHAQSHPFSAFGENLKLHDYDDGDDGYSSGDGDEDPRRKKAARTLSLSQLTMGKGQRAVV